MILTDTASKKPFLWGAATSGHQIEGNNVNSDWWFLERMSAGQFEPSGDAVDSYHRYAEDMSLLAEAGLTSYRFGIEWARIEPLPGQYSRAELAHYRRMIEEAMRLGLTPVVTLHHFTHPKWFLEQGGWDAPDAIDLFVRYCEQVATILEGVEWVCTINEPNILTLILRMYAALTSGAPIDGNGPSAVPDITMGRRLAEAHRAARDALRPLTTANIGWSVACQAFTPTDGNEEIFRELKYTWEDFYLEVAQDDDFVGVQSYTSQSIDANGVVPHQPHPTNTLAGWAYRPDALAIAVRNAADITGGTPILITENGIATEDDTVRIRYTDAALVGLAHCAADGIDVRGYMHWSLLDNYEWGHWAPTFGLIHVDRETFARTPKPSLAFLGQIAQRHTDGLAGLLHRTLTDAPEPVQKVSN